MFLVHHLKMKTWVLFSVIACIAEVSSMFLSLLYHLEMNNPVIVGKINDLKNKDMIQLFKDVNGLDQSICMITVLKNDSLQMAGVLNPSRQKSLRWKIPPSKSLHRKIPPAKSLCKKIPLSKIFLSKIPIRKMPLKIKKAYS